MKHYNATQILIIIFATILLLTVTAVTYAFFTANVNNDQAQTVTVTAGTMALSFSDNDNGINEILNFGDSITKKLIIENTGTLDAVAKISWLNLTNTYLEGSLTYSLEYSENASGPYTKVVTDKNVPTSSVQTTVVLADSLEIPAGKKYYYNLIITLNNLPDVNQTQDINANFNTRFTLNEGALPLTSNDTLTVLGLSSKETSPNFNDLAITDETKDGVYAMEDDYGTSYYFRGAVENNYVYFAGYYWRIIRINGDGSLRILYDGTNAYANNDKNIDRILTYSQPYSRNTNDNAYVGYMYGTIDSNSYDLTHSNINDSDIKQYLDNWYKTNIIDGGFSSAVSDEIFCNDRGISKTDSVYTGNGTKTEATAYLGRERLDKSISPRLTCPQKNDAFTVTDTKKGNGNLTYPIGLITGDEIVLAGGKYNQQNSNHYLSKGYYYWSMTAYYYQGTYAGVMNIDSTGALNMANVVSSSGIAPGINLSAKYCQNLTGTGTMSNPYTVG